MLKNAKCFSGFAAVLMLWLAPFACASAAEPQALAAMELKVSSLAASQDYIQASAAAYRLARARSELGDTAAACAALSQSLDYYRMGLNQEVGDNEVARSSIEDYSDGMAVVRAKFGCEAARVANTF